MCISPRYFYFLSGIIFFCFTVGCSRPLLNPLTAKRPRIMARLYDDCAYLADKRLYYLSLGQPAPKEPNKVESACAASSCPATQCPPNGKETAKLARNSMAYGVMADIQQSYDTFKSLVFAGKGMEGVSFDFMQLGLTAATAIAPAARTKTIFGALATAVTGLNLSVETTSLAKQTYSVIAVAMDTRHQRLTTR